MAAVFQLSPGGTFGLIRLVDSEEKYEWEPNSQTPVSPIQVTLDSIPYDAYTAFRLVRTWSEPISRNGFRQHIVLRDAAQRFEFTVNLDLFSRQAFLHYQVNIRNLQRSAAWLESADLLPWSFDGTNHTFRTFRVNQWVNYGRSGNFELLTDTLAVDGTPVTVSSGAHGQHCGWLALRDEKDHGIAAGWEFDGRLTATAQQRSDPASVDLSARIQSLHHAIPASGDMDLPAGFVGLFQGNWDDAGYRTQQFTEAALAEPQPEARFPYVIWDSWRYQERIYEATLRQEADLASRIGIELFVLDLGWALQIGDWHADPAKFPSGLRAFSDYVHSLGMKFGLHFPLAEAMRTAPVLAQNPDWTATTDEGYFDALSLCLSHQPVQRWVVQQAVRMIDEYGVDWILQDGENMVKHCVKATHTHDPRDSNYANSVEGLNAVIAAVKAERPLVHWENCEDGGNMMTFNMVKNYVTSIAADDSGALTTRQAIYGVTYPFSPRYADRYMPDEELNTYITRSFMFGGPWIFMNRLTQMEPESLELARAEIQLYKNIRQRVTAGRVYHLTARPVETRVDALQSYDETSDRSIVFVWRPTAPNNLRIRLRGLRADGVYRVTFQGSTRRLTLTGAQLMNDGFVPRLPGMWTADVVYVDPVVPVTGGQ